MEWRETKAFSSIALDIGTISGLQHDTPALRALQAICRSRDPAKLGDFVVFKIGTDVAVRSSFSFNWGCISLTIGAR